jgi:hypothetical protein
MKKSLGLLGVVISLAVGYFIFINQIPRTSSGQLQPRQQIDLTGVKKDLLNLAQAERLYATTNSTFGTIEQLKADGTMNVADGERRGYQYDVTFEGAAKFRIVARPVVEEKKDWPTLVIDETMEIRQE